MCDKRHIISNEIFSEKIDDFDTQDMNFVLITGDTLYQKLRSEGESHDLLHFSDIPKFILFQSFCFTVYGKKVICRNCVGKEA